MYKLIISVIALILIGCVSAKSSKNTSLDSDDYRYLAPYVNQNTKWTYKDWGDFMSHLNDKHLSELALEWGVMDESTPGINSTWNERVKKVLYVGNAKYAIDSLGGRLGVINKMQTAINKAAYYISFNKDEVKWHEVVLWANSKVGSKPDLKNVSSYSAEKVLLESFFDKNWDKLDKQERENVIEVSELQKLKDSEKGALVKLKVGSSAIALLKTSILLKGFSFYTTMSSVISATAGVARITLPFAVYMAASNTVSQLTGPLGWGVIAASTAVSGILSLAPDELKVLRMIASMHVIKTKALMSS